MPNWPGVRIDTVVLDGGLDLVTPSVAIPSGRVTAAENYERGINGGYRRINGFERFDGRPSPSEANYWVLNFDAGEVEIVVDDEITGGTSTATGIVLITSVISGSWSGGDAAGYVVLYGVSGVFQDDEDLEVSTLMVAIANGEAVLGGADTDIEGLTWLRAAVEATRGVIEAVPGSGEIRGVWGFDDVIYAFRDNVAETQTEMYKSTTTGWVKCGLGNYLEFNGGLREFTKGLVLTGRSSGATAIILQYYVDSGSWRMGDAAGVIYFEGISGGPFTDNEIVEDPGTGYALADGDSASIELLSGGKFEFKNYNFKGSEHSVSMFGCDGVNKGFQWTGSSLIFIHTGMTGDTPQHIIAHKKHLFFSFTGGSLQHSSIGDPFEWSPILGASELAMGDAITGLSDIPGGVLAIFTRNATSVLYGSSSVDWELKSLSNEAGAISWSVQKMGRPIYLDDRGITTLAAIQQFGDFQNATLSKLIQPLVNAKKGLVVSSVRIKSKNQYRIFFSDESAWFVTFDGDAIGGIMPVDYGMVVQAIFSAEDANGNEVVYCGDIEGYIYQMDKGTSFDGDEIESYLKTAYNSAKSPEQKKRYRKLTIELDTGLSSEVELMFFPFLSFGQSDIAFSDPQSFKGAGGGGVWNINNWNNFYWSGPDSGTIEGHLTGTGKNIAFLFYSATAYEEPHTITSFNVHYSFRSRVR